ncbi:MAG TPA: DsbA family protein [Solirubrobacteraceae bacterium]
MEVLRPTARTERSAERPLFYYDLADPNCYLVAERVMSELPVVPEWEPVLAADLLVETEPWRKSEPTGRFFAKPPEVDRERLERLAAELGLQPLRWPAQWPPDSREAMLAAAYAKRIGRAVAFSLAAFRQAFAGGRDLGDRDTILIAGAACEIHPSALLKALSMGSVSAALQDANARAQAAGVRSFPAIQVGDAVFDGEDPVGRAAEALLSSSAR